MTARGLVVPLTADQRVTRLLYLVGERRLDELDEHVRRAGAPERCPAIFYSMDPGHNGGTDPTAPDPASRWKAPGKLFVNRTCDCVGAMAWAGGWDRYQPARFNGGWFNTDSMWLDAGRAGARCFRRLERPELGCYVVYRSGAAGRRVGHIGGIVELPAEFAPLEREWWDALGVVDVASRGTSRANVRTTGRAWWRTDAWFVVSTM